MTPGVNDTWVDNPPADTDIVNIHPQQQAPIWWYHSDHLGSSSYITDLLGKPVQYYEYLPFGEIMVQQSTNNIFENVYKFNGKELDEQTGYYYYGARYYDPGASIFLSVDPLAETMPNYNPYVYTFNNPINLTDPTGMAPEGKEEWIEYKGRSGNTQYIYDSDVKTKEEATTKGYQNVKNVSKEMTVGSGKDSYQLSDKATVTNLTTGADVKPGFMTADGSYIGENNMSKSLASGLQEGGNKTTTVGTGLTVSGGGALGVPLASFGSVLSGGGTLIELGNDLVEGKLTFEKIITKSSFFLIGRFFGGLGKNQSEKLINEGVISILEHAVDDARDNKKGPYKK